jgi:hypothetical protein
VTKEGKVFFWGNFKNHDYLDDELSEDSMNEDIKPDKDSFVWEPKVFNFPFSEDSKLNISVNAHSSKIALYQSKRIV